MLLPSLVHLFLYIGNSAVSNFLTPCGLSRGLAQISLYFFVNNIAVIVARLTVGRLIVYLSKKTCILLGVLLSAGGTALIAVARNMPLMLLSAVLMGLGLTAAAQLLQAQVMLTTPSEHRGVASTVFTFMGDIGTGAGAALWGALSAGAGYTVTYLLAGASTLAGGVFHGAYWKRNRG
ncbi:MFS transporter [Acutalibacter muris]|uniref:MFS transporter n=1 Tax=Acutalibacter muris TaxID=1796620 RepID=A0AA92L5I6_9FIRM|nr:MFS transporter [Acutalibacter muris]QQR29057.1 MFS transporter [Acutalibacter muris]